MTWNAWTIRTALVAVLAAIALAPWAAPGRTAEAATLTVNKTNDTNDGTCDALDCSLREAINAASDGDTVSVPAGTYGLTIAGADENLGATGDLDVDVDLTIEGAGSGATIINGNDVDRVLDTAWGAELTLKGLTVRGGNTAGEGGGILARVLLTLDDVTVEDNVAGQGGGISTEDELVLVDSEVSSNTATGQGGGIYVCCSGVAFSITDSDVIDNTGGGQGAGIFVNVGSGETVSFTFDGAEVSGNTGSGQGGGFFFNGNYNTAATVTISDTIFDGNSAGTDDGGGMFWNVNSGGATTITITGSDFRRNQAGTGGGIYLNTAGDDDSITIKDSFIRGNEVSSGYGGGGLYFVNFAASIEGATISDNEGAEYSRGGGIHGNGPLEVVDTTIDGNSAGQGGGVFLNDDAVIETSTISNNSAASDDESGGGGIYNDSTTRLLNSTVTGNTTAGDGGGIYNDYEMEIVHATIAGNSAVGSGDQIYNDSYSDDSLQLKNSIVDGSPDNCGGGDEEEGGPNITSLGNNIDSGTSCQLNNAGDQENTDPMLGALADNGGPTYTRALLAGSPAIDAAEGDWCLDTDQRGVDRPVGPACDIGAFEGESQGEPEPTATATATRTAAPSNTAVPDEGGGSGGRTRKTPTPTPTQEPAVTPEAPAATATVAPSGAVLPSIITPPDTGTGAGASDGGMWLTILAFAVLSGLAAATGAVTVVRRSR